MSNDEEVGMEDGLSLLLLGDCVVVNEDGSAVCGVAVGYGLTVGLYITVG